MGIPTGGCGDNARYNATLQYSIAFHYNAVYCTMPVGVCWINTLLGACKGMKYAPQCPLMVTIVNMYGRK